jgi:predicted nucleic acid-binding protein
MNGTSLLVDTNIVIYHLNGDKTIESLLEGKAVFLSFISKIELFSFKKLTERERSLMNDFISHTQIIHSNEAIADLAIKLKQHYSLKVPDSIIVATSLFLEVPLLTADKDLVKLEGVRSIFFQP